MKVQLPPIDALKVLTEKPGQCYVAHGGRELYVSDPDRRVVLFMGPDFGAMSDDEISQYIIDQVIPE